MFNNASGFNAGDISQINSNSYHHSGSTANVIKGDYLSNVEIKGNVYNHNDLRQLSGSNSLKDLYENVAVGALHNSSERCDAPKCHEQTRVAVQENIFSWITDGGNDAAPGRILWLTGPAGSGKTAIMGSVAEACQRKGQLAASFFFSSASGSIDRQSKRFFVTTLAYQLKQVKVLESLIGPGMLDVIEKDPAIFRRRLEAQIESLILGPLRLAQGKYDKSTAPRVIIIDGLDECEAVLPARSSSERTKEHDQTEILSILFQASQDPSFPFKIIIASRPESWIRRFLSAPLTAGHAVEIFLDSKFSPDEDIALFLRSKFAELKRRYEQVPASWPSEEAIETLVANSSGQFIYAATVMRFIETLSKTPQTQLDIVLSLRAKDAENPFGPLDALYTKILMSSPDPDLSFRWLRAHQFLGGERISWGPDALFFNAVFESSAGEAYIAFGPLPSLIMFPRDPDSNPYVFYHKSFLDYLKDPSRCQVMSHLDDETILQWMCGRFGLVLVGNGPEVATTNMRGFTELFLRLWDPWLKAGDQSFSIREEVLSKCDPAWWGRFVSGDHIEYIEDRDLHAINCKNFCWDMYVMVHRNCRKTARCLPSCRRWRKALRRTPFLETGRKERPEWSDLALIMDRFCLKRIPPRRFIFEPDGLLVPLVG